jgi:hypothetical protein
MRVELFTPELLDFFTPELLEKLASAWGIIVRLVAQT